MTQENSKKKWSAHAEQSDADSGQSLGVFLQRERQKKQLSIEEIAEATRIQPEMLQALEAGNRNLLPVSVFTRGFVKIYAGYLGLNQAEVLERFNNEWGNVDSATPEILSGESMAETSPFFLSFRFYSLLLIIALLISLAYFFFQADDTPPPAALTNIPLSMTENSEPVVVKKKEVKQLKIIPTPPPQETLLISPQSPGKVALGEDEPSHDEPIKQIEKKDREIVDQTIANSQEPKPAPAAKPSAVVEETPPAPTVTSAASPPENSIQEKKPLFESINLHIRFVKKTRISVAQDDGHPEKFIFAPGEESSWQAARHITLHVDDADAVELILNGSPISVEENQNGSLAITLPTDLDS